MDKLNYVSNSKTHTTGRNLLTSLSLHWCYNECDGVSNHQPYYCLFNRLYRRRSKKILKLRVTGLCPGNSLVTGEFPAQRASKAENVSIWWRYHDCWKELYRHSQDIVSADFLFTHGGLVMPYGIIELANIIRWGNSFSPFQDQAITWTDADLSLIGPFGTNFTEIVIKIHWLKSLKEIHSEKLSVKHRPLQSSLSVLTQWGRVTHIWVSKLTTTGSDNGLLPGLRQTII